ncbi:cupin domain protein [bacterium BMS3Abin07]|nr:cupin domain protein [bacterium BMS3Abin07]GBE32023.1 cupin domain protein [bacterium BMS3Bbin05]HDO21633.1 cupin domain-containing protein [Nitrospirota bacterium]HDZ88735.1 cupin domain-containing protein [Nitrospirota bacterium]
MSKKNMPSCDCKHRIISKKGPVEKNHIYRHKGDYSWAGIKTELYKPEGNDWSSIIRRVLIGSHGEKTGFHIRYFEIEPGGCSSFERHRHEHAVIVVRGRGEVRIGRNNYTVGFLDTVYIKPDTPHRLKNPFKEPFGFLCIVNAKRDAPIPL